MSTSSQSSATATVYEVSNAADGVILKQQMPQQHPASSASQRFHPYLVPYGRDSSALSTTFSSSSVDRELNRGLQHVPDHHGSGLADADSPFSGRRTHGQAGTSLASSSRRLREFIPDCKKDDEYWMKRQKNNEAAKRSREKRRINDMVMTKKILELNAENKRLRLELEAIKRKYGLLPDVPYPINDDISGDRSISPVCVGISSSDDSTPPSSFPLYLPVSHSSPSPPILDRCYTEPLMNRYSDACGDGREGKALPPLVSLTSLPYQLVESYHLPITGQQKILQQNMPMPKQPLQQTCPAAEETVAMVRHLQSHTTTSTLTPAKISYLRLENLPSPDDQTINPDGTKQLFNSKIRTSGLTDDPLAPSQTTSLASVNNNLAQDHFQPPQRVMISTSEMPPLTFSDLSSDDEDDARYDHRLLSPEAPLNLTKRSLSWQPPSTRYLLSNSNCRASRDPIASLRNDSRSLFEAFQLQELPYNDLWSHQSKDSSSATGSQTLQQERLYSNQDVREMTSSLSQPQLSMLTAKSNVDIDIKVEAMERLSNLTDSTKRLKRYSDACGDGRDESMISSDLTADSIDTMSQNASRQVRGGVPLKVWHKRSVLSAAAGKGPVEQRVFQEISSSATTSAGTGLMFDDQSGSLIVDVSPNSSPSSDSVVNYSSEFSDSDSAQAQQQQKRQHNNVVAWKCRENRKLLTDLNLTAATILESENNKLKEELRSLSREVTDLKEIIGKKDKDSRNGNPVLGNM